MHVDPLPLAWGTAARDKRRALAVNRPRFRAVLPDLPAHKTPNVFTVAVHLRRVFRVPGRTCSRGDHRRHERCQGNQVKTHSPNITPLAVGVKWEIALVVTALAELRHGNRNVGVEALKRLLRRG